MSVSFMRRKCWRTYFKIFTYNVDLSEPDWRRSFFDICQLKHIFKSKTIPCNVPVGFLLGDKFRHEIVDKAGCLGNSSPNKEDLLEMYYLEHSYGIADFWRLYNADATPWEDQQSLPVFCGRVWISVNPAFKLIKENLTYPTIIQDFLACFKVVNFSVDNLDLLDAHFSGLSMDIEEVCLLNNEWAQ